MIQEFDAAYYRRREAAARELAASAIDARTRQRHLEAAELYATMGEQALARAAA